MLKQLRELFWFFPETKARFSPLSDAPFFQEDPAQAERIKRVRAHIESQIEKADQKAMAAHGPDCDIFICNGCFEKGPDKIGKIYEVHANIGCSPSCRDSTLDNGYPCYKCADREDE